MHEIPAYLHAGALTHVSISAQMFLERDQGEDAEAGLRKGSSSGRAASGDSGVFIPSAVPLQLTGEFLWLCMRECSCIKSGSSVFVSSCTV